MTPGSGSMADMASALTARRPSPADAGAAIAVAMAVFGESALWRTASANAGGELGYPAGLLLVVSVLLGGAVLLRRSAPGLVPLVPAAVMVWSGTVQPAQLAPLVFATAVAAAGLAYLAGGAGRRETSWGLAALAVGGIGLAGLVGNLDGALFVPIVLVIFGLLPWLVGRYRRQQQALVRAGAERIAQLEREQHILAERVRWRERVALAEEMHDSLGHELTLVALRAGALELAPELPDAQRGAAGELRAATGAATARLAEIVTVLRAGPPPEQPVSESLERLVQRVRGSGLAVDLRSAGQPPPELAPTVHRTVQEALTNAAKHAPGAAVTVVVTSDPAGTQVTVTNPRPPAPGVAWQRGGHGLAALRERVRLLGGEVSTARPDGGFQLRVRFAHRQPVRAGERL